MHVLCFNYFLVCSPVWLCVNTLLVYIVRLKLVMTITNILHIGAYSILLLKDFRFKMQLALNSISMAETDNLLSANFFMFRFHLKALGVSLWRCWFPYPADMGLILMGIKRDSNSMSVVALTGHQLGFRCISLLYIWRSRWLSSCVHVFWGLIFGMPWPYVEGPYRHCQIWAQYWWHQGYPYVCRSLMAIM